MNKRNLLLNLRNSLNIECYLGENKITTKPLPNDDGRARDRLEWLKVDSNRFILSSVILSLKTQSDGSS